MKINYWIISDTHFGHKKVYEYDNNRIENYENITWFNLKSLGKDDILIHLGDFCFYNYDMYHEMLKELKCKKYLILGNHDCKSMSWYLDHEWNFVCYNFTMELYGYKILFTHKPFLDYLLGIKTINIHGHLHGDLHREEEYSNKLFNNDKQILIKVNHKPQNLLKLIENYKNGKKI